MPIRAFSHSWRKLIVWCFCSVLGLIFGFATHFMPHNGAWRTISSITDANLNIGFNRYTNLECPSPANFQKLAEHFHFRLKPEQANCADPIFGKLGRLFFLLDKLNSNVPESWRTPAREPLQDPSTYITRQSRTLELDLNQENNSFATNIWGNILLGDNFFRAPPLFAISALVREARHSDKLDPGLFRCNHSEAPRTTELCDETLSLADRQGVFSFDSFYLFGLAEYNSILMDSDRQYLYSMAAARLMTSFNRVPLLFSKLHEVIYTLSDAGQVYLIHPLTNQAVPLDIPGLPANTKISHIDKDLRSNGLVLTTTNGKLWTWAPGQFTAPYPKTRRADNFETSGYKDFASVYVKEDDKLKNFLLTDQNQLLVSEHQLSPYRYQPDAVGLTASHLFMALGSRGIILSENGELFGMDTSAASTENGAFPKLGFNFQDLAHDADRRFWRYATGGITAGALYGVANDGKLWQAILGSSNGQGTSAPDLNMELVDWPAQGQILVLKEGLRSRVSLNKKNTIIIKNYSDTSPQQISLLPKNADENFIDLVIAPYEQSSPVDIPLRTNEQHFSDKCEVRKPLHDPWLGVGMGINKHGHFVYGLKPAQSSDTILCQDWPSQPSGQWQEMQQAGASSEEEYFFTAKKRNSNLLLRAYHPLQQNKQ